MKPYRILVLCVVVILGACAAQEVTIGAIVTTTNAFGVAPEGVAVLRGVELAIAQLNETGGIAGHQARLVHADPEGSVDAAVALMRGMEAEHAPLFYVSTLSSISQALAREADVAEAPVIALAASAASVTQQTDWLYRLWPTTSELFGPTSRLARLIGVRDILLIYADEPYGRAMADEFYEPWKSSGIDIDLHPYPPNFADASEVVAAVDQYESVFVVGFPSHLSRLLPAIARRGFEGDVLTTSVMSGPALRTTPGVDGAFLTAPAIYNTRSPRTAEFLEAHQLEFGVGADHFSGAGFDAIKLVAGLMVGSPPDRNHLRDRLDGAFTFHGASGTLDHAPGSHTLSFPQLPARVTGESLEYL